LRTNAVSRLASSITDVVGAEVELERPSDPAHGDYATNVALRLAGAQRRAPRELAAELAEKVAQLPEVERAEVAGPGFLNLFVTDAFLAAALEEIGGGLRRGLRTGARARERRDGVGESDRPDPVSAARNGAYGDSVARLLEFAGHEVVREFYYNDAGAQMERFRESVEAVRRGEDPPEDGYRGAYIDELARLEGDPVQHMVRRIEDSLERFRIHFDVWTLQSVIAKSAGDAIASIETYENEGTVWARTTDYGDDKDRPLVRSSDGSFLYFAADVAYVRDKFERGFDRLVYVLGADHHGYVARLKAAAAMLGYDVSRLEILLYQTVHLTKAGEQTKMSKRRGDIVFLEDLMDEIGVDAARWYLVNRGPDQAIDIDIDLAAEKSQKNPVYYVQYAHARVAGILRNAPVPGTVPETGPKQPLEREERDLIKRLAEFPAVVAEATERRAPHGVPTYAIRVADDFHRFYHEHRVLESEQRDFRLALCRATQHVIARSLDLIGVEAPERM
jgi:arginyl-tRNA synthetase